MVHGGWWMVVDAGRWMVGGEWWWVVVGGRMAGIEW